MSNEKLTQKDCSNKLSHDNDRVVAQPQDGANNESKTVTSTVPGKGHTIPDTTCIAFQFPLTFNSTETTQTTTSSLPITGIPKTVALNSAHVMSRIDSPTLDRSIAEIVTSGTTETHASNAANSDGQPKRPLRQDERKNMI